MYPEARYANVGTASQLPLSVGKLVKLLKVPVVVLNMKGNYLQSPIWNLKKRGGVKLDSQLAQIITKEEADRLSPEEIQKKIQQAFYYDEYKYQKEANIRQYPFSIKTAGNYNTFVFNNQQYHPIYQILGGPTCLKIRNIHLSKSIYALSMSVFLLT